MTFKDYFSTHAVGYRDARPDYPESLFDFIFSLCAVRELAWDCACGNGQASSGIARGFQQVFASDASA